MKYRFLKSEFENLIEKAVVTSANNGKEVCGFLVNNGYFLEPIPTKNKTKRGGGFSYYINEVNAIEKATIILNHEIVGTFHSHPFSIASPGKTDIEMHDTNDLLLIIDCNEKEAKLWKVIKNSAVELDFELI